MRSLGCSPCTGAIRSEADTLPKIIDELSPSARPSAKTASSTTTRKARWRSRSARAISRCRPLTTIELTGRLFHRGFSRRGASARTAALLHRRLAWTTANRPSSAACSTTPRASTKISLHSVKKAASTGPPARIDFSLCSPTACAPSASRASPSTSPTATSPPPSASSSSPTPRATSSTPATWRPALPPPIARHRSRRCAQRRTPPVPPSRLHRLPARHPAHRRRRQQNGSGRL